VQDDPRLIELRTVTAGCVNRFWNGPLEEWMRHKERSMLISFLAWLSRSHFTMHRCLRELA
jgi:hypothetical protein